MGDTQSRRLAAAIGRAKAGDQEAFRYLYVQFRDAVQGYARSIVRDEHEAEDISQQVFARLSTSIGSYEDRGIAFSSWLLRITHNASIDHLRRRRAVPVAELRVDEPVCDRGRRDLAHALRSAIAQLPQDQREVIVLRHIGGLSPTEIAERLDRSTAAVNTLHTRARHRLKGRLVELDAVPITA